MRVSDRSSARNYLKYLNNAKGAYAKTLGQIESGNRFEQMSEDISAGTRVLRTRADLYKANKQLDNVTSISDEMSMAEDSMTSIQDILTRVHELAVKGATDSQGEAGRTTIANEIKNIKGQLLTFSNTKYGQKYIFGGSNSSLTSPFAVNTNGNLTYNGIDVNDIMQDTNGYYYNDTNGNRQNIPANEDIFLDVGLGIRMKGSQVDKDTAFQISFSGIDVLGFGKDASTGLPNNIYNILNELEKGLRSNDSAAVGKCDTHLTSMTDKFRANLTDIGAKTNFLENMETRLKKTVDTYTKRISNLMGINDAQASMEQSMNEYVLKAVLQMGSNVLPVSLMDFLN